MQIAALLSDLKSLSVCPHEAALNLVTVHQRLDNDQFVDAEASSKESVTENSDPDLQRANDLISLHYGVKVKYMENGLDPELLQARREVANVLSQLAQNR
jgi:hypothetical protein